MLLIHLFLNPGSVECTLKYVYYHFIFPKINKRGGWKILQKLISGGGRLFGTREYEGNRSTKFRKLR